MRSPRAAVGAFAFCWSLLLVAGDGGGRSTPPTRQCYSHNVTVFEPKPVLSYVDGSSTYAQVFNPSWIESSAGTNGRAGLLVRTQNCLHCGTANQCCKCSGTHDAASVLTFARLENDDNMSAVPAFRAIDTGSVVFGPHNDSDCKGTEDPRVVYDSVSKLYYIMYTCYGTVPNHTVSLCLASSTDPTSSDSWVRHGPVGLGQGSKSGALLLASGADRAAEKPHHLYWGAGEIRVAQSSDVTRWKNSGKLFLGKTLWGNPHVESGPPPLRLTTGDYVFFINSWGDGPYFGKGYQPGWVVMNASNLTQIIAQATEPLWSPDIQPWMTGEAPYTCNVGNVSFVEAAHPTGQYPDEFRLYFGGADAVVGSAVVRIEKTSGVPCTQ